MNLFSPRNYQWFCSIAHSPFVTITSRQKRTCLVLFFDTVFRKMTLENGRCPMMKARCPRSQLNSPNEVDKQYRTIPIKHKHRIQSIVTRNFHNFIIFFLYFFCQKSREKINSSLYSKTHLNTHAHHRSTGVSIQLLIFKVTILLFVIDVNGVVHGIIGIVSRKL